MYGDIRILALSGDYIAVSCRNNAVSLTPRKQVRQRLASYATVALRLLSPIYIFSMSVVQCHPPGLCQLYVSCRV